MDKLIISIAIEDVMFGMFVSVPPGYVGCIYSHSKGVLLKVLRPGLHLKLPFWHKAKLFNTQVQEYQIRNGFDIATSELGDAEIIAATTDLQNVIIEMTILFHIDSENATQLWQHIGDNYIEKIIRPTVRSRVRTIAAQYTANDFFSSRRAEIEQKIHHELMASLSTKGIVIVDALLGSIGHIPQ
ncbi:MAG: prohibitin family protein [Candidatus Kerfeldbacteria bacterium]|nr:prohibitin family protein [Candidatus Kerfeldbacteria bacterium]